MYVRYVPTTCDTKNNGNIIFYHVWGIPVISSRSIIRENTPFRIAQMNTAFIWYWTMSIQNLSLSGGTSVGQIFEWLYTYEHRIAFPPFKRNVWATASQLVSRISEWKYFGLQVGGHVVFRWWSRRASSGRSSAWALEQLDLPIYKVEDESAKNTRNYDPMKPETEKMLKRFYQPHNERMKTLLGDEWSNPWAY